jgi:methylated-DNA-[protein]-cysteine S-methyltransferase
MTIAAAVLETPAGPLSVLMDGEAVCAAGFTPDPAEMHRRLGPSRRARPLERRAELGAVTDALLAYFAGQLDRLDGIAVDQEGTAQQRRTWDALRRIPAGMTSSYGRLAAAAGAPSAIRAAGTACGRNLVAPIVPCHRAVHADGSLGGYYYGLDIKRWLLDHERGR